MTELRQQPLGRWVVMFYHEYHHEWAPEGCAGEPDEVRLAYATRQQAGARARQHGPGPTGQRAYILPVTKLPSGYYTFRLAAP